MAGGIGSLRPDPGFLALGQQARRRFAAQPLPAGANLRRLTDAQRDTLRKLGEKKADRNSVHDLKALGALAACRSLRPTDEGDRELIAAAEAKQSS